MSTTFKVGDYVVTGIGTRAASVVYGKVVDVKTEQDWKGDDFQMCRVRLDYSGRVVDRRSSVIWGDKRNELVRIPRTLVPAAARLVLDG